jgi:hypothetical protein
VWVLPPRSTCVTLLGTALHCHCSAALSSGTPYPDLCILRLQSSVPRTPSQAKPDAQRPATVSSQFCLARPCPPSNQQPPAHFWAPQNPNVLPLHNPHTTLTFRSQHQIPPPRLVILYTQTSCLITSICVSSPPAHHVSNHACAGLLLFIAVYLQ